MSGADKDIDLGFRPPRLPKSIPRSGVSAQARLGLRQLLGDLDRQLADLFFARCAPAITTETLVQARAQVVERVVSHVWIACVGDGDSVALYAVGGFGRGELFPFSDVDLLVLGEERPRGAVGRALESFFTCLWDIGLKPGSAVRTLAECREFAAGDATIYTSLLDAHLIHGRNALVCSFVQLLCDERLWPREEYFAAKRDEERQRRARYDDTAYNLEPNLKEGPGGLRALQLVAWFGQHLFDAPTYTDLIERGLMSASEASTAEAARGVLWRFRFALHLVAGRSEERLLFDYQREIALRLGYSDEHVQNLGVEQCMQDFFRSAIAIQRLHDQFVQRCEEALDAAANSTPQPINPDFVNVGGRLDCDPPDLFLRRPAALIDLFRVWIEHPEIRSLRADLVRRINEALIAVGDDLACDEEVNAAFARLLRKGAPAVDALVRMNRHGVLARYLPAFGRIVGRMQYDLFHVYTVDEHTMRVLRHTARFADVDASADFGLAHELFERLAKPELLLLAALFHDIAKGRGGDHSELGESEAREFCLRIGLPSADIDLVAWLVRWHLMMSVTAQTQDISDADVVHAFAVNVADSESLDYLYLLTVADIAGTSAKLWNSWKSKLLADLYASARYMLRAGLERPPHAVERIADARGRTREALLARGLDDMMIERIWADFSDETFLRLHPALVCWQTMGIANRDAAGGPLVLIDAQGPRGGSEVFVHARDGDGLFAAVTAVFDRLRISVFDARIFTSNSGMGMDSFLVLDQNARTLDAPTVQRLSEVLGEALVQTPYPVQAAEPRPARRLRHFNVPVRIEFTHDAVNGRTQLALVGADQPGLLAGIAQMLRVHAVRVHDARIATFGERAEDFFLLSDEYNRPLVRQACEALRVALGALLVPQRSPAKSVESHAIS